MADAEAGGPPLVGVHQIVAVFVGHAILTGFKLFVTIGVFAAKCPSCLVARLKRWVGNFPGHFSAIDRLHQREEIGTTNTEETVVTGLVTSGVTTVECDRLVGLHHFIPRTEIATSPVVGRHGVLAALEEPVAVLVGGL